jgi:multisubunit Na+/H+ antiporter MnhG subunit
MSDHPTITACLLALAVGVCFLSAVGLAVMRDAYQRLQFCAPVTSLAGVLFTAAIWFSDPAWQARIKAALTAAIFAVAGAVLTHATARSIRIRELGHWPPKPDERQCNALSKKEKE